MSSSGKERRASPQSGLEVLPSGLIVPAYVSCPLGRTWKLLGPSSFRWLNEVGAVKKGGGRKCISGRLLRVPAAPHMAPKRHFASSWGSIPLVHQLVGHIADALGKYVYQNCMVAENCLGPCPATHWPATLGQGI